MKVAVFSESPTDDAVIRILIDKLLGTPSRSVGLPFLRTRNWASLRKGLSAVIKYLHYQTDAEGLVVILDANHSPLHDSSHDEPDSLDLNCRFCQLRQEVIRTQQHLSAVPARPELRIAIGLAAPALEAWLLCGKDRRVSEQAWRRGLQSGSFPYSKQELKKILYGTERVARKDRAIAEARRVAENLNELNAKFPMGFGLLRTEILTWREKLG